MALAGVIALLAPSAVALAQEAQSLADVIAGKVVPLTMKPKDLPKDYLPMKIKTAGSGGGLMDMFGAMFSPMTAIMGGGGPNNDPEGAMMLSLMDLSWTKGDVVKVNGKDFVVTYKWNVDLPELMTQSKSTDSEKSKGEVIKNITLSLSLVAVDSITSLSPVTGMTRDDLVKFVETPYVPKPNLGEPTVADDNATMPAVPDSPQAETLANMKNIAAAMSMYTSDYDDLFPGAQSTKAVQYVTFPYCKNNDVWKTKNPNGGRILFNMSLSAVSMSALERPDETVMFYEERAWPDGTRSVAFADSHVRLVAAEEWKEVEKTLHLSLKKSAQLLPMNYGDGG